MATESDNVNTGALATIVVVGALAMIGITTALTALVRTQEGDKYDQMNSIANLKAYQMLVASQRKELEEPPSWDDKDQGIVRVPIERAEQLVVGEIQKNPSAASPVPPDAGADAAAEAGTTEAADAGAAPEQTADAGAAPEQSADAGAPEAPKPPKQEAPKPQAPKGAGEAPAPAPQGSGAAPTGGSEGTSP